MKEVGNKLRLLRNDISLEDAAAATGVSRETLRKIEDGQAIKLSTLKSIWRGLDGTEDDWTELLCTWLRWHARAELDRIVIEPRRRASRLRKAGVAGADRLAAQFRALSPREQRHVEKAIRRPQVLRSIAHLNDLFESASKAVERP